MARKKAKKFCLGKGLGTGSEYMCETEEEGGKLVNAVEQGTEDFRESAGEDKNEENQESCLAQKKKERFESHGKQVFKKVRTVKRRNRYQVYHSENKIDNYDRLQKLHDYGNHDAAVTLNHHRHEKVGVAANVNMSA